MDCTGFCSSDELERGENSAKLVTILDVIHDGEHWWEFGVRLFEFEERHHYQSIESKRLHTMCIKGAN